MDHRRRSILCAGAGVLTGAPVAGCLDDPDAGASADGDDAETTGYAAFFTLWDWASQVGGEQADFENPVGVGTTGHGWSPDGAIATGIAETDVFVYLDTPAFRWAQRAAEALERDYDDVVVVDGLEGIDVLEWDHEHGTEDQGHDGHGHGHDEETDGDHDPHVWLDPVRSQGIVENVAEGLARADPDNAEAYESNAAAYVDRLADLDDRFRETIEAAPRDVAVAASHDSYTYLEDRYGFDLHTPVGVSPQDQPSHGELVDTIELVDDEGIEVILYDAFESQTLAETIVDGSAATDTVAITSAEGTTATWNEQGWGYVEQMEEINRSAFERALGS